MDEQYIMEEKIDIDALNKLTDEELETLCTTPASKWDIIKLRESNHHLRNGLQIIQSSQDTRCMIHSEEILEWRRQIDQALYVEIRNGNITKKSLAQAITDDRNDLKILRHLGKVYNFLTLHWLFTIVTILLIVMFDQQILAFTRAIANLIGSIKDLLK